MGRANRVSAVTSAGEAPRAEHRFVPGVGVVMGLVGMALFLLTSTVLPWASRGGADITLFDIQDLRLGAQGAPGVSTVQIPDKPFVETYADWLWIVTTGLVVVGVALAALMPGVVARAVAALVVVMAAVVYGAAVVSLDGFLGGPDPSWGLTEPYDLAYGTVVGGLGIVLALAGCLPYRRRPWADR